MNNIVFTDIDGVLNPNFSRKWNKKCINIYNKICEDFDLKPVITSTWRIKYNIPQLQEIFINQGIIPKIYDYTTLLYDSKDIEINKWLRENECDKYIVIDDKNIEIPNFIHCKGWIGLSEDHYRKIKKLLKNG